MQNKFWQYLDELIAKNELVIDRPKGSVHPNYPSLIFPIDYGYLKGTVCSDGGEIDVWLGSLKEKTLDSIFVTVDLVKNDSEIKLLLGCSDDEKKIIYDFYNGYTKMAALLIERK